MSKVPFIDTVTVKINTNTFKFSPQGESLSQHLTF